MNNLRANLVHFILLSEACLKKGSLATLARYPATCDSQRFDLGFCRRISSLQPFIFLTLLPRIQSSKNWYLFKHDINFLICLLYNFLEGMMVVPSAFEDMSIDSIHDPRPKGQTIPYGLSAMDHNEALI